MELEVTIGVCVRNNADTIVEALQSIFVQDFPLELMELIVVEGSSQDKTLPLVQESLQKTKMKNRVLVENRGLGLARQLVVANALGKYIVWVDGDMVISRDFVSKLFTFMETNPKIGIAKGKQALKEGKNLLATLEAFSRAASKMVDYSSKKASNKVLGTSGCIYRTEAIKQAGGFDETLRGYCEDWDAEIKVRSKGWAFSRIDAFYLDYERNKLSWKNLWKRYWLRGYYTHYFLLKNKGLIKHSRMFPPAAFIAGLFTASKLYPLTRKKAVYTLPLQHFFKYTAWYVGYYRNNKAGKEPRL